MDIPERHIRLRRAPLAWRWAANTVTVGIFGLGLLAIAWRGAGLLAASIIVLAALVDGADGALARRAGGPSALGAVLDIVGDLMAFGAAPAALALAQAPAGLWPLAVALGVYQAAALARLIRSARLTTPALARFAGKSGASMTKPHGLYLGLPMPTAGCLVAGLALNLPPLWVAAGVLAVSALAISRRTYPSVPWMWQQRRASLIVFLVATAAIGIASPRAGLLFGAAVCAAYPWARPVRA